MAKKKSASGAAEKRLKAAVKKLRAQLAAAEKSADKWRAKAKSSTSVASGITIELAGVRRRLEKAEASVLKWKDRARRPAAPAPPKAVPDSAPGAASPLDPRTGSGSGPDDTWTVAALRAEARRRGLTGYSRKRKAELLAELRG